MPVSVALATTPADLDAVRGLCRDWVTWQLGEFPDKRAIILQYFEPVAYERTLAALPEVHARPGGAILLARSGGRAVGCVMYLPRAPGVAEVKRLFVSADARGIGAGRALVEAMCAQAKTDGYTRLWLETARFLTAAAALYAKCGFTPAPPPADSPEEHRAVRAFMEKPL